MTVVIGTRYRHQGERRSRIHQHHRKQPRHVVLDACYVAVRSLFDILVVVFGIVDASWTNAALPVWS